LDWFFWTYWIGFFLLTGLGSSGLSGFGFLGLTGLGSSDLLDLAYQVIRLVLQDFLDLVFWDFGLGFLDFLDLAFQVNWTWFFGSYWIRFFRTLDLARWFLLDFSGFRSDICCYH